MNTSLSLQRRVAARSLALLTVLWSFAGPTTELAADEATAQREISLASNRAGQVAQGRPPAEMNAGLTPAEAARQMSVPAGFHVQLAAGEPLVHQPIAMTIDHRGRVWIAEAHTYPQRAPDGQGKDKIVILEDTDLDGVLDKRKVFADKLNLVSGLEVGFGGVWVGAAPYLLFIPDADQDDVPDAEPEILLDGFGYQDTHETLNAFIWGPDGWLYGCHGVFTHSLVGPPATPQDERVPLNAAVWRYHPTRRAFDIFARGTSNPWGVDFDDHGQAFITACVIPHLWHVIQGARYHRQGGQHFNPHVYDDIKTIADHSHYTGDIRDSAWWGHEPELSDSISRAGGGHAHCGAMIYLGDNWPATYRNSIYFHNVHGNRVNNDLLERRGSGYVGRHGPDFLFANDKWFRGINLKYGPDGSVHLIDWYDKNACHRSNPEIWDRTNGRIYRVFYGDVRPSRVDLSHLSSIELTRLQTHQNDWYVRMARRLLQERFARGDTLDASRAELERQLAESPSTPQKLRALWALHVTGGVGEQMLSELLRHPDEVLRAWAIQLAVPEVLPGERPPVPSPARVAALVALADDAAPLVRLYAASALQRIAPQSRWAIARVLADNSQDADDHNLPLMIWYGVEPLVPLDVERALRLASNAKIPQVTQFIYRRAASQPTSLAKLFAALPAMDSHLQSVALAEVLEAFSGRVGMAMPETWQTAYTTLMRSENPAIRQQATRIAVALGDRRVLPGMRKILADPGAETKQRLRALEILMTGRDAEAAPAMHRALDDASLRGPVLRALASYDHFDTPGKILSNYRSWNAADRRDAIAVLSSRAEYVRQLINAIEQGLVPRNDLHVYHVRQIESIGDAHLTQRLADVWGTIRETSQDKREKIAAYREWLTEDALAAADLSNGRQLYNKTCAACHRLFGEGGAVGPDITGANRTSLDYLLDNLVDPSAVVSKDYKMTVFALVDGRIVTGLVEKESDSAFTVRTVNDVTVVAKADIEDMKLSEQSLMPDGQLDQLDREAARDLIGYLASPKQVPLPESSAGAGQR